LKGGNTQEFWKYQADSAKWTELDTMPLVGQGSLKKKKVKNGADVVPVQGTIYALKGNGTFEYWRYVPGTGTRYQGSGTRDGVMAQATTANRPALTIGPNPLRAGFVTIHLNPRLLGSLNPAISIYDASGRRVLYSSFGTRTSSLRLDLRSMPAGAYFLRLEAGGFRAAAALLKL